MKKEAKDVPKRKSRISKYLPFRRRIHLSSLVADTESEEHQGRSLWESVLHKSSSIDDLNVDSLNQRILDLLHKRTGLPINEDSKNRLADYSIEEKREILRELSDSPHENTFETVDYYIEALSSPESLTTDLLNNLQIQLKYGTLSYVQQFEENFGIQYLVEALRWANYKCCSVWYTERKVEQKKKTKIIDKEDNNAFPGVTMAEVPSELESEQNFKATVDILCHILRAIISLLHHPTPRTHHTFSHVPDCIPLSITILQWCPLSLQADVFLLIAGGVALKKNEQQKLFEALKRVPLYHQQFFHSTVYPELARGTDVQYKISYLTLVNTVISVQEIPEDRPLICNKYIPPSLLKYLRDFALVYPDEAFCVQLDLINDILGYKESQEHIMDSPDLAFNKLDEEIKHTEKPIESSPEPSTPPTNEEQPPTEPSPSPTSEEQADKEEPQTSSLPSHPPEAIPEPSSPPSTPEGEPTPGPPPLPPLPPSEGAPPPPPPPPGMAPPPLIKKARPYIAFKIKPLSEMQRESSVFGEFDIKKAKSTLDENVLLSNLKRTAPRGLPKKELVKEKKEDDWQAALLAERQQTFGVEVVLRGLSTQDNALSVEDILHALKTGDVQEISQETVGKLISLFPYNQLDRTPKFSKEEAAYNALTPEQVKELSKSQAFLHKLYKLGSPLERLFILQAQFILPEYIPAITSALDDIMICMESFHENKQLKEFLDAVVFASNVLMQPAMPITSMDMSSLSKLKTIKTADKKKTLLHVIIEAIRSEQPGILQFPEKIKKLEQAYKGFSVVIESSSICKTELKYSQEYASALGLENCGDTLKTYQQEFDKAQKTLERAYASMEYFGYTQARSAPTEFYSFWIDFIATFKLSLKWLQDSELKKSSQNTRKSGHRLADELICSVSSDELGSSGELNDLDASSFRSGVINLRNSSVIHVNLRTSGQRKK